MLIAGCSSSIAGILNNELFSLGLTIVEPHLTWKRKIMIRLYKIIQLTLCLAASLILSACGGGGSSGSATGTGGNTITYALGGSISGLNAGTQVTFQVIITNGSSSTSATPVINSNGTFSVPSIISANGSYVVKVLTQPTGETCTVSNGSGNNVTANVSTVQVVCSSVIFTVAGKVSGLLPGQEVVLLNNSDNPTTVSSNSAFVFTTPVALNGGYSITVQSASLATTCTVVNGTGVNVTANITNVSVACSTVDSVVYSFGGFPDAAGPQVPVIQGVDGNFYGTSGLGGTATTGKGTVYEITAAGKESILHSFTDQPDGRCPQAPLIEAASGIFYGTTCIGGQYGKGTVFKAGADGTESVLWSFGTGSISDGANPYSGLTLGTDGNLYGTTSAGGAHGTGTIYKINPAATTPFATVLYSFGATSTTDAREPHGALVLGKDGNFYGTSVLGGTNNRGAVFVFNPIAVTEHVLHSFGLGTDGDMTNPILDQNPGSPLVQSSDLRLYGTTPSGGVNGSGTVFAITPSGVETVLYSFGTGSTDGKNPIAGLMIANDGNFYGTTYGGGKNSLGTLFEIDAAGNTFLLYSFGAAGDGANPVAPVIQAKDGHLYGTTYAGGAHGAGTFFKF
ncbi:putative repeat protein (TIGR03803 family) [Oxalobacteraceae bacterium GrIS 2.11]